MPLRDLRIVIVMFDIRNYRPGFELSDTLAKLNMVFYSGSHRPFAQQRVVHFAIRRRFHRAAIACHADGNLTD